MLVPDYDAADLAPSTEQIASSYRDAVEEVPWIEMFCLDCDPAAMLEPGSRKFVRSGPLAANLDIKTYDSGNVFVCTTDGTAVNWGKIWVEYDVDLFVPQLPPTGSDAISSQHITGASPTTSSILGTQTQLSGSTGIVSVVGNVLTFLLPGKYAVSYSIVASTSVTVAAQLAVGSGGSFITTFVGDVSLPGQAYAGNAGATFIQLAWVLMPVGGTLTFDNTVSGGTTSELVVTPLFATQT